MRRLAGQQDILTERNGNGRHVGDELGWEVFEGVKQIGCASDVNARARPPGKEADGSASFPGFTGLLKIPRFLCHSQRIEAA